MIVRKDDIKVNKIDKLKDGIGSVKLTHITDAEGLCNVGRLFSIMELEPGDSIGSHIHEEDFEIYYILEGNGQVTDDNLVKKISAGDAMITHKGHEHSIKNTGDSVLKFIALILYT